MDSEIHAQRKRWVITVLEQTLEQFPHAREWLSFLEESLFEI